MKKICLLTILAFLSWNLYSQMSWGKDSEHNPIMAAEHEKGEDSNLSTLTSHKNASDYSKEDWQLIIDEYWGAGYPTEEKLVLFDKIWNNLNANYPCFSNLDIDFNGLRDLYRPEIAGGVSHGRFVAIIDILVRELKETHLVINNSPVDYETDLEPGVPIFYLGKFLNNAHFGAALTPLPDSTALVYKAFPDHPLGLIPGDIVLGYEGVPWKILYKQLLDAELPVKHGMMGSTTAAWDHIYLGSAGLNWHLFDTIDIVKYVGGDTLHLPTIDLAGQTGRLVSSDQLELPGIPFWQTEGPDVQSIDTVENYTWQYHDPNVEYFSWGVIENTNIGYLSIAIFDGSTARSLSIKIADAIKSLINDQDVSGLIFDVRLNYGGRWGVFDRAFSLLYNTDFSTVKFSERCGDENDHFQLCDSDLPVLSVDADPYTYFDRPIAVLTGPGSVSAADQFILKIDKHPMARIFGKSPSGAFSAGQFPDIFGHTDWWLARPIAVASMVEEPDNFLAHVEYAIDEEIWLDRDSVAIGVDNVVARAVEWINNKVYPYDAIKTNSYQVPGSTLSVGVNIHNPSMHDIVSRAYVKDVENNTIVDSIELDLADGNLYSGMITIPASEATYSISYKTTDLSDGEHQLLPDIDHFTTKGLLSIENVVISSGETALISDKLTDVEVYIRNHGESATVNDVQIRLISTDECITYTKTAVKIGNIEPNSVETHASTLRIKASADEECQLSEAVLVLEISEGDFAFWSDTLVLPVVDNVSVFQQNRLNNHWSLNQNFPNPFQTSTTIIYQAPSGQKHLLIVYNLMGKEVRRYTEASEESGRYKIIWDGRDNEGNLVPQGIYFYKLQASEFVETRRMIFMR